VTRKVQKQTGGGSCPINRVSALNYSPNESNRGDWEKKRKKWQGVFAQDQEDLRLAKPAQGEEERSGKKKAVSRG